MTNILLSTGPFPSPLTWVLVILGGLLIPPVIFAVGVWLMPIRFVRFVVWVIAKLLYRIEIHGIENVPKSGPVLITPNHVSWIDGFLVMLLAPRHVCMLVYAGNFRAAWIRWLADVWKAIMISPGPKSIMKALKVANTLLGEGRAVGIFPEGGITRTGQLQAFKPGMMKILKGTDAAVVPMYLDGLWGSIFSYSGGKFFWKMPRRWRYPIAIYFGKPLRNVTGPHEVRQAVQALGANAMERRKQKLISVSDALVRSCKQRKFRSKLADSSGVDVTGGQALMRALILRRLLRSHILAEQEQHIGILLPPSAGAVITNMAVALDRRVPVNLNYTVSSQVMNECIELAEIKHVLTSRKVMEKMNFDLNAEVVYLEDLREKLSLLDKVAGAAGAYALPAGLLSSMLGLGSIEKDDVLTIIFTSGSTGTPKGVMLTYANIASNVEAIDQVIHLDPQDVIIGILPFFHSFGFTVTLWCVASLNIKGIYHFNPLDARQVGKLSRRHGGTILLSTPTFLRSYLRRCEKVDFEKLDTVVAGAEKLPVELCDAFEKKFGVRPVEGYGTTELSPLVSVNVPPSRAADSHQEVQREGSVGRCVPGVSVKTVSLDDGTALGVDQEGMLLVKGANVMKGYLKAPEKTAEVVRDGWYVTGDVAKIDSDGFIHITGRQSRFSKIGGEMVPHIKVEEELQQVVGMDEEQGPSVAVTAVPDLKKGERLVVLHTQLEKTAEELVAALKDAGLPNLFIPSADSFMEVPELPVLGTGKLDLKGLKQLALEAFEQDSSRPKG